MKRIFSVKYGELQVFFYGFVMSWWLPHNFEHKKQNLMTRSLVIKELRRFFDARNFTEIDTPSLQICPVMDAHIHAFKTVYKPVDNSEDQVFYLHTSPEFDMKKLLSAGMERIYQISHVYRNGEATVRHLPEFMLLEWYRANADYTVVMDDCILLLRDIIDTVGTDGFQYGQTFCNPHDGVERLSVCEAFLRFCKIDLRSVLGCKERFAYQAERIGVRVVDSDSWDDVFHAIMADKIEPHLGCGVPTILYDYPVSMAALSRVKSNDSQFAERFELYVCGVELANAFSELTDGEEQRRRYREEMDLKQKLYGVSYPPDEEFFKALDYGMPESAGVALGVDRLIMLACGVDDIQDVQWARVPVKQ